MSGEDAYKIYGQFLTPYEKEEVKQFEIVYYMNVLGLRKTLNIQTQESEEQKFNYGYDNEDGDYLFEANDHINYRYEIQKKLGKGAFGVVIKVLDHKTKEYIALKILKNKKKLHKQGKIEIKILELLRDNDVEDKKNIVITKDSFTFRSHVVSLFLSLHSYSAYVLKC